MDSGAANRKVPLVASCVGSDGRGTVIGAQGIEASGFRTSIEMVTLHRFLIG